MKSTLQEMVDRQEHFAGVVVIARNKDGSQYLRISTMSSEMKAGLFCLFQAFINDLYRCEDDS